MYIMPIGATLDGVTELFTFSRGKLDRDYTGDRQGCRMGEKGLVSGFNHDRPSVIQPANQEDVENGGTAPTTG